MSDDPENTAGTVEQTEIAPHDSETGVAMTGDYPANHRLRAEALASEGKDTDPDGEVTPELIADAKTRLDRSKRAEAKKDTRKGKDSSAVSGVSATEG